MIKIFLLKSEPNIVLGSTFAYKKNTTLDPNIPDGVARGKKLWPTRQRKATSRLRSDRGLPHTNGLYFQSTQACTC